MKILHIMPSFYPAVIYGGPIESVHQLCRHISRLGGEVRVLTTDANGPKEVLDVEKGRDILGIDGIRIRYCRRILPDALSLEFLQNLYEYIKWADVVHLTSVYSFPVIPSLFMCRMLGKPMVWSPRGSLQRWEGSTRVLLKKAWDQVCNWLCTDRSVCLHVTSELEKEESLRAIPNVSYAIIANGVSIPEQVENYSAMTEIGRRLLFIGRLHPKKGLENLIEAMSLLDERYRLTICGDGEAAYRNSLQKIVDAQRLTDRIRFVGHVEGALKSEHFQSADVCIVPSHTENFGMVVVEALAHSVPVIASQATPWKELESRGCGSWVANDPATLASAISSIYNQSLIEMGRRGRAWMEEGFGWENKAKQMLAVYERAIQQMRDDREGCIEKSDATIYRL